MNTNTTENAQIQPPLEPDSRVETKIVAKRDGKPFATAEVTKSFLVIGVSEDGTITKPIPIESENLVNLNVRDTRPARPNVFRRVWDAILCRGSFAVGSYRS